MTSSPNTKERGFEIRAVLRSAKEGDNNSPQGITDSLVEVHLASYTALSSGSTETMAVGKDEAFGGERLVQLEPIPRSSPYLFLSRLEKVACSKRRFDVLGRWAGSRSCSHTVPWGPRLRRVVQGSLEAALQAADGSRRARRADSRTSHAKHGRTHSGPSSDCCRKSEVRRGELYAHRPYMESRMSRPAECRAII